MFIIIYYINLIISYVLGEIFMKRYNRLITAINEGQKLKMEARERQDKVLMEEMHQNEIKELQKLNSEFKFDFSVEQR